jgi:uncharacterized protein YuzE
MRASQLIRWDPRVDAAYISIGNRKPKYCREVKSGILLNFNASGGMIGIEVLDFSSKVQILGHTDSSRPILFDPEIDAADMFWSRAKTSESEELQPGVILSFDRAGHPVGLKIERFSGRFGSAGTFANFMRCVEQNLVSRAAHVSRGRAAPSLSGLDRG